MSTGQKFSRNKKRSPSMAKYNGENRWERTKAKRVARHAKAVAAKKLSPCTTHGQARALRRARLTSPSLL